MSFFHAQEPIQTHHDHSYSTSIDDELDMESAALIAKLALDDLADVMGSRKGKARADSLPSDDEVAYQLQREQYDQWLSIVEDAKLAKSIEGALVTDAAYLDAYITAEEAAAEDRIAAEFLSRGEELPDPKNCQTRLEHPNFIMDPELVTVPGMNDTQSNQAGPDASNGYVVKDDETVHNESIEQIESVSVQNHVPFSTAQFKLSNAVAKRSIAGPSVNRKERVNCIICQESCRYFETFKTPCNHNYCRDCLIALVEAFTRDESLFPLRCCQDPIPVAGMLPTLPLALRSLFERKNAEFSILTRDRIYCSNHNCSIFLGSSEGRLFLFAIQCFRCFASTCPRCKESAHPGARCGVGTSNEALQALAKSEGWQTCPGCNAVVELNLGCYHMTCRCRTQFCYLCAELWKTCNCVQWDEDRLMVAAQEGVENELGHAAAARMPQAVFAERVEQRAAILRDNHHCERHSWWYRAGGGTCGECHYTLPQYLLICTQCSFLACVRCSRNRL